MERESVRQPHRTEEMLQFPRRLLEFPNDRTLLLVEMRGVHIPKPIDVALGIVLHQLRRTHMQQDVGVVELLSRRGRADRRKARIRQHRLHGRAGAFALPSATKVQMTLVRRPVHPEVASQLRTGFNPPHHARLGLQPDIRGNLVPVPKRNGHHQSLEIHFQFVLIGQQHPDRTVVVVAVRHPQPLDRHAGDLARVELRSCPDCAFQLFPLPDQSRRAADQYRPELRFGEQVEHRPFGRLSHNARRGQKKNEPRLPREPEHRSCSRRIDQPLWIPVPQAPPAAGFDYDFYRISAALSPPSRVIQYSHSSRLRDCDIFRSLRRTSRITGVVPRR